MSKDIYQQDNILLDAISKDGKAQKRPMEIELISDEEKRFIEQYSVRLSKEQNKVGEDEIIVYTKISMNYAVQHSLCHIALVFHPCSLAKRQYYQNEEVDSLQNVFKDIIIWETTEAKTYLTSKQLDLAIKHFRFLESKA